MSLFPKKEKDIMEMSGVEAEIFRIETQLKRMDINDPEYMKLITRLKILKECHVSEAKAEKEGRPTEIIAAVVTGLFSIVGIGLIKMLEFDGPITTKAFGWIPRGRG